MSDLPPPPPPPPPPPGGDGPPPGQQLPGQQPPGQNQPPGWGTPPPGSYQAYNPYAVPGPTGTDGLAIASLVLGVVAVGCCGPLGLVAVGLGIASLRKTGANPALSGRGLAIAGIVVGAAAIALTVVLVMLGALGSGAYWSSF